MRRYKLTANGIKRREREGRCVGRFAAYIPWILVHEISSQGWSTRAWSEKMQRVVHTLSRLEYLYFLRLEFSRKVVEFYEQYKLPFDVTKEIARPRNWTYPRVPGTEQEIIMTSDFVIREDDGRLVVRSIKPREKKEESERVRQKLKIEYLYWKDYGGADAWGTLGREEMNQDLDANIEWVWQMRSPSRLPNGLPERVEECTEIARSMLLSTTAPLVLDDAAEQLGQILGGRGLGTSMLRHLLAIGAFPEADYTTRFDLMQELPLLRDWRFRHAHV